MTPEQRLGICFMVLSIGLLAGGWGAADWLMRLIGIFLGVFFWGFGARFFLSENEP